MKKFLKTISLTLVIALMSGCQVQKQDTQVETQINSGQSAEINAQETNENQDKVKDTIEETKPAEENITNTPNSEVEEIQDTVKQEVDKQADHKTVILNEVNGQTNIEISEGSLAAVSDNLNGTVEVVETKNKVTQTSKPAQVQKPAATTKPVETQKPAAAKPVQTSKPAAAKPEQQKSVVTLAVYSDEDTILSVVEVKLEDKETVFDVLKKILKDKKIQFEYTGKGDSVYVQGINNLYEFDKGATSGWMYNVNGTYPNKSAGAYVLKPGDTIEWRYTLDLGKDLGANAAKK